MKINIPVRMRNKAFWIALIPAVILLIQLVLGLFGISIDLGETANKLIEIVNAVFAVLAILGVVNDPTTYGFSDSKRAMTYTEPYKDEEAK